MNDCVALIVAAGRGSRAGGTASQLPKQYRDIGGAPVLRRSLETFSRHPQVSAVRAVIHPSDRAIYEHAADGLEVLPPVLGGTTRQESVRLGLESIADRRPASVLIHDAARPFVDDIIISRALDALATSPGAIPAIPLADALKRGSKDGAHIEATIERDRLWRAQTPQAFRFDAILAAHRAAAGVDLPDDAAVAERAGLPVALIAGNETNFKITTEEDLARAQRLAAADTEIRVGQGFDTHRFGPGSEVRLCGVSLPHDQALIGHSDADVALHSLTDAILGALAAGDIGQHFPPSDPRWRNADSATFLRHSAELARKAGASILHADVTIICEAPKISPHRRAMAARLAAILGIDVSRCSVKATTTEGLGFTGRREGIAAQATATLRVPTKR
jgi:2-C-methyl-D-erythritol 4-phosphate cytidylyltransferase/2-C-methyl-D-erythritol 2,4-cyclodiphosphate synthase